MYFSALYFLHRAHKLLQDIIFSFYLISVIDDENPTVYTAGAIVTVTVSLTRKDMKHLFGDDSIKQQTMIDDSKLNNEAPDEVSEEQNQTVKKPAWLRQKKGQKKSHKKGTSKKFTSTKNAQTQLQSSNNAQQTNTPNAKKKEDKIEKESSKDKLSDVSDSDIDSDRSNDEDNHEKKDMSIDDDDTEWER